MPRPATRALLQINVTPYDCDGALSEQIRYARKRLMFALRCLM